MINIGLTDPVRPDLFSFDFNYFIPTCSKAKENYHPSIASDYYLTGEDVRRILHISVRTLQNLRDTRQIPYTVIGGKYLYPEEELLKAMRKNYRNYRHQK